MNKLLLIGLLFGTYFGQAQDAATSRAGAADKSHIEGKFLGFGFPKTEDLELVPQLTHIVSKNESSNKKALKAIKAEKMKLKEAYLLENTIENIEEIADKKVRTNAPSLIVGYNALGNQGTPSDNTIAINTLDQIVCIVNSSLRIYNANSGAGLAATVSLANFFSTPQNGPLLTNNLCDPKVIFDPEAKRFIVFAQTCDGGSSTSQILFAFAKGENPLTAGWYFYTFTGNPSSSIGQNVWFDYPKLAVSNSDVFATGNLFNDNYDYVQSIIYQINKNKCYAGNTLGNGDALIWYNIDNDPFTMVPMSNGQLGGYGNQMYLASTGSTAFGTYIKMYEITNSTANNPSMLASLVPTDTASAPADAIQSGTSTDLDVGDGRGMDGFYLNGTVHYVFHSDVGQGYSGVNYSRLTKSGNSWILNKRIIKMSGKDLAFPAIASMGWGTTDQSAIIGVNYASSSEFPGMKAIYVDHDFTVSTPIEIKTGTGYASVMPLGGITRWGDYSGMARMHHASKPTAWHFGMFGNTSHTWTNHFAKISTNGWPLSTEEINKEDNKVSVYPNPIIEDIFQTRIHTDVQGKVNIVLLDLNGKFLRSVYEGYVNKGENLFSFNKGALATGTYILNVKVNDKLIKNEKISIIRP